MKNYFLAGEINHHQIKFHSYSTREKALKSLGKLLFENGLQVETSRVMADNTEEFICNYYTRFFVGSLH